MPKDNGANVCKGMRERKCEPGVYTHVDAVQVKSQRGEDHLQHERTKGIQSLQPFWGDRGRGGMNTTT